MPPGRWQPAHFSATTGARPSRLGAAAVLAPQRLRGQARALRAAPRRRRRGCQRIRGPLRMLRVICTPKLAENATDFPDRAPRAESLAYWRQEIRVGLGGDSHLRQRPRGSVAVAFGPDARRALALAPLDRRIDLQELHLSAGVLRRMRSHRRRRARPTPIGLKAERRRFDLGLDEALLDRGDCAELRRCAMSSDAARRVVGGASTKNEPPSGSACRWCRPRGEDLLCAQRDGGGVLGRQRERLVRTSWCGATARRR